MLGSKLAAAARRIARVSSISSVSSVPIAMRAAPSSIAITAPTTATATVASASIQKRAMSTGMCGGLNHRLRSNRVVSRRVACAHVALISFLCVKWCVAGAAHAFASFRIYKTKAALEMSVRSGLVLSAIWRVVCVVCRVWRVPLRLTCVFVVIRIFE